MPRPRDPNKPTRKRKTGPRRAKGEYATFDVQIEGLSAKAQELSTHGTFVDDIAGGDNEPKPLKSGVIAAREREAKTYAEYAKAMIDQRNKFIDETSSMQARMAKNADALIKRKSQPTLRSNAKPGERSLRLGDKLEIIIKRTWRRF